ncbi:hypothetical protein, partial [Paenisporosarcina sp.]|uniref:hypothetical protein n=1 Tax=Paenisporosarcina sp. TaxID=1932001 RepID=UPI003C73078B
AEISKIYISSTNAIISSLGHGEKMETIYQSIIDQRYKEFKNEGVYITNGIKYVDISTDKESIFIVMNENDNQY